MNILEIKNLSFSYKDKKIFDNLDLNMLSNKVTMLIGSNGSGKSTLINLLLGLFDYEGSIYVDNILLNKDNVFEVRKRIGYVCDKVDELLIGVNVLDNLVYSLENLGYEDIVIKERLDYIVSLFKLDSLLNKDCFCLTRCEKQLVNIASSLMHEPKLLIIDEGLNNLDKVFKKIVFDGLLEYKNRYGLSILIVTHDSNLTLLGDNIVVLDKGCVLLNGDPFLVYSNTKLLCDLGIDIPFIIKLSNGLIKENVIDLVYLDKKKLVDNIWN